MIAVHDRMAAAHEYGRPGKGGEGAQSQHPIRHRRTLGFCANGHPGARGAPGGCGFRPCAVLRADAANDRAPVWVGSTPPRRELRVVVRLPADRHHHGPVRIGSGDRTCATNRRRATCPSRCGRC
jgi:hypothetical protein